MIVKDLINISDLQLVTNISEKEITNFYISDLLTPLLKNIKNDCVCLITTKSNINCIAVAGLLKMSCVIMCECENIETHVINKANEENIVIFKTNKNSFEVAKELSRYE